MLEGAEELVVAVSIGVASERGLVGHLSPMFDLHKVCAAWLFSPALIQSWKFLVQMFCPGGNTISFSKIAS